MPPGFPEGGLAFFSVLCYNLKEFLKLEALF